MFININGPPVAIWNPISYVRSWLIKYRSTNDNRSQKVAQTKLNQENASLWKILLFIYLLIINNNYHMFFNCYLFIIL